MIYPTLVKLYSVNIYKYGNKTFDNIPVDYHVPVKQYSAENYTLAKIYEALTKGYITEQEYAETLTYIPKQD